MQPYGEVIERAMRRFFDSLSEKDRRRYAAVEAAKLGHGGVEYMAQVLGCDPNTIYRGRGGVEEKLVEVLRDHTAGDPMREGVKWTDLTRREISQRLGEGGTPAGVGVVKQLLKRHGHVKRKAQKVK